MATNSQPVTGATIEIYRAEEYGQTGPIITADAKPNDPGYYKAEGLDDGDYTYKISASGKGSLVGDFSLPGPLGEDEIEKNIPPITLISGADVNITVYNKDGHVIVKSGEDGPTGPEGVTGITGDLDIETSRLIADGGGEGVYTVDAVPIGERLIEIKPSNVDLYQNLKILRNISTPTTDIDITLYPPVTMYVTVYKNDPTGRASRTVDTTCRLFQVTSTGVEIKEITTKTSNDFKLTNLSDGDIHLLVISPDGEERLSDIINFKIAYNDTENGILYNSIMYEIE